MSKTQTRGLGRGLASLIPDSALDLDELPAELVEGMDVDLEEDAVLGAFEPPDATPELREGDRAELLELCQALDEGNDRLLERVGRLGRRLPAALCRDPRIRAAFSTKGGAGRERSGNRAKGGSGAPMLGLLILTGLGAGVGYFATRPRPDLEPPRIRVEPPARVSDSRLVLRGEVSEVLKNQPLSANRVFNHAANLSFFPKRYQSGLIKSIVCGCVGEDVPYEKFPGHGLCLDFSRPGRPARSTQISDPIQKIVPRRLSK